MNYITQSGGIGELAEWAVVLLILLWSLVQTRPIKHNPWDSIFGWIGKKTNGTTEKQLDKLEKHIREMWINNHRQTILIFSKECRVDIEHSSDEWTNVLNVAEEYEKYVPENKITFRHHHPGYGIHPKSVSGN